MAAAILLCALTVHSFDAPQAASARPVLSIAPRAVAVSEARVSGIPRLNELPELTIAARSHPLSKLSRAELIKLVHQAPHELGSVSLGKANRGRLLNAVHLPENAAWKIVNPAHAWATQETIEALERAFSVFQRAYPKTSVFIGDLSKKTGGYLRKHRSHQSGRDIDVGYVYLEPEPWYARANAKNLDRARTWTLLKAFLSEADVEYIFIDRPVQRLLHEHALAIGEDPSFLESLFESPKRRDTLIRHAAGHATHFHVRLHNNIACETARLVQRHLDPRQLANKARVQVRSKRSKAKHVGARTHSVRRGG